MISGKLKKIEIIELCAVARYKKISGTDTEPVAWKEFKVIG